MNKMWKTLVALLVAVILAGSVVGCAGGSRVSVSEDGNLIIDGIETDFRAENGKDGQDGENGKSAYELYKEAHADYAGDEAQWLRDLTAGRLAEEYDYTVISNVLTSSRRLNATVTSGTATVKNRTTTVKQEALKADYDGGVVLDKVIATLHTPIILPLDKDARWQIELKGTLGNGQILTSLAGSNNGRVYLGANSSKKIYLGICLDGMYTNYRFEGVEESMFEGVHTYVVGYENGEYALSVDGGAAKRITGVGINQSDSIAVTSAVASAELTDKIRAVTGQNYVALTNIGGDSVLTGNGTYHYIKAHTSSIYGYRELYEHPLADKNIFYLGSSITYGASSGGKAFGEMIGELTGNAYQKQAVSGTTLVNNGASSYVARFDNFDWTKKPDLLVVQLSTNDFSQNKPMGEVIGSKSSEACDQTTVTGAIEYIVAKTQELSPDTKVVFYTCAVKEKWGFRAAYADYIEKTMPTLLRKWKGTLYMLDLFNADYARYVEATGYMGDDIHPNATGYAHIFVPEMLNCFIEIL